MASKQENFAIVADAGEWKRQLITKEDPTHLHKTLGIACLLSFIWRFCHIGPSDMAFKSHPHLTYPTLFLHLLLTVSAFTFKIPKKRIKDGTRIWPEYRMHALVFLTRSLIVIGVYHYEELQGLERNTDISLVLVLCTMAAADLCSFSVAEQYRSNSVREIDTHPAVKFFFSTMQFYATAAFLMGLRRYTMPFLVVMTVQLTPFLGTLRRKNLISANFGAFMYGLFLVVSYVISAYFSPGGSLKQIRLIGCIGFSGCLIRLSPLWLGPFQNKYFMWTVIGLLMRQYRPQMQELTADQVTMTFRIGLLSVLALGYWKVNYGYNNSTSKGIEKQVDVTMGPVTKVN
jgi:hypothetical protein